MVYNYLYIAEGLSYIALNKATLVMVSTYRVTFLEIPHNAKHRNSYYSII